MTTEPSAAATLDELRQANVEAWSRDTRVAGYESTVIASCAEYLPALEAQYDAMKAAMDAAYITVKYGGDSTVKKLWRAAGYDMPRKAK